MAAHLHESANRFLTFEVSGQLYALPAGEVIEVIKLPTLARVPQGPPALLGLANLRGTVLPVASLHLLLGRPIPGNVSATRVIVLDLGSTVGITVDSVATLEAPTQDQIDARPKDLSAEGSERLLGAFPVGSQRRVAKILDIQTLLEGAFSSRKRSDPQTRSHTTAAHQQPAVVDNEQLETLVTCEVAGQEYAFQLAAVQEILPVPDTVTPVAHSDVVVLGLTSVRNSLLPLLSLRALLGFAPDAVSSQRKKVFVVEVGNTRVGLVADQARGIVMANAKNIDPVPPALAARTGGESRISSVYRGHGGRLISILSPRQLFREDVMQRLVANPTTAEQQSPSGQNRDATELIVLVFRLGADEFGLPIESVLEVARVPEQLTRVPKAPKFLDGVMNLRGEVLPVVDQRRRFDMPVLEHTEARRLVVVRTESFRAGVIVDSVSDVLRTYTQEVAPPPKLTDDVSLLVRGVINLPDANRMVLLLDPTELLTRAERSLLDKFESERHRKEG